MHEQPKLFRRAVLRLTVRYSIFLLLLFAGFSSSVYLYMVRTFDRPYHTGQSSDSQDDATEAHEADVGIARLRAGLLFSYGGHILLAPIVSYGFAKRTLHPVAESYEAQQRFVDDASHELRTPLSVIQGELDLALSQPRSNQSYKKAIHTSLDEVDTLARLVANLLLLARGSNEELHASFQTVILTNCVQQAILAATAARPTTKLKIDNKVPKTRIVFGQPELIEQAFTNLINNAIKFTPGTGTVVITSPQHNISTIEIDVQDTGIGMDQKQLTHAFDRFWRAENVQQTPGHGLGLALVKQIMQIHHGTVELTSKPSGGTTARLIFPVSSGS